MDRNLLHISYEAGILEDPWLDASDPAHRNMYKLSVSPEDAPDKPEYIQLDFDKGNCVGIDGQNLSPLGVMQRLNQLGGKHGIGRADLVENRFVGMKSRGVYETPGGAILHFAHRQMESLTMDREVMHLRDSLIPKYAELVYYGFLVCAGKNRSASPRHRKPNQRLRHRPPQTLQRKHHPRRPKFASQLISPGNRHNGSGSNRSLPPRRLRRVHPAERAAPQSSRPSQQEKPAALKETKSAKPI